LQTKRFDEFWGLYPKKVGKGDALKSWKKIKPTADLFNKMIAAVKAAQESEQWQREKGRYIPNPSTWLNQGRWDDELPNGGIANESNSGNNAGFNPDGMRGFKNALDDEPVETTE
jgi:hypothetical protein